MPTTRIPGFVLTDHVVELLLDHSASGLLPHRPRVLLIGGGLDQPHQK